MPQVSEINLLRAKTGRSPEFVAAIGQLRTISVVALVVVLGLGLLLGIGFGLLSAQAAALTEQKRQLVSAIGASVRKENLFLLLKKELELAGKVLAKQKQLSKASDLVLRIASPPALSSFNLDDKQVLTMKLKLPSVAEAAVVVGRLMSEVGQNRVKSPVLQEFELAVDGSVSLTLSFAALL